MRWSDIPFDPPRSTLRQFAALSLAFGAGLSTWEWFGRHRPVFAAVIGSVGLAVGLLGLARPRAVRPVFVAAMVATFPIGWVLSQLLLAVLYYGVLTPLGLAFRLAGRDALELRRSSERDSYWSPKVTAAHVRQYYRQY